MLNPRAAEILPVTNRSGSRLISAEVFFYLCISEDQVNVRSHKIKFLELTNLDKKYRHVAGLVLLSNTIVIFPYTHWKSQKLHVKMHVVNLDGLEEQKCPWGSTIKISSYRLKIVHTDSYQVDV